LDRRDFLKTTGTLFATAALPGASALAGAEEQSLEGRAVLPMNRNWRYHPAKVDGAELPGFDDSKFERVVIPHTNISLPWHSFDDKEYEFVSTYRRRFKTPRDAQGKRIFVDFEGAMTASTVWINGVLLGEYKGGFTPFSFELTRHIQFNGENVLV
jgi:beta-galactosidase